MESRPIPTKEVTHGRYLQVKAALNAANLRCTASNRVWHHDAPVGSMQLVDKRIHQLTEHRGGFNIWGRDY